MRVLFPDLLTRAKEVTIPSPLLVVLLMVAPRRKYTNEMKLNAVHLVQNEGRRACDVADELGIDRNTLYAWLRDARNGKLSTDDPAREVTPEQAEISRLRAELARSRQECALLKKFAAYLSTTGLK